MDGSAAPSKWFVQWIFDSPNSNHAIRTPEHSNMTTTHDALLIECITCWCGYGWLMTITRRLYYIRNNDRSTTITRVLSNKHIILKWQRSRQIHMDPSSSFKYVGWVIRAIRNCANK